MVHASDFWFVDDKESESNEKENNGKSTASAMQRFEQETLLYQWGTKTAVRRFCKTCGVLPFYIPRSNQDGYAITYPCVDWGNDGPPTTEIKLFDGVRWEESHAATGIAKETANENV